MLTYPMVLNSVYSSVNQTFFQGDIHRKMNYWMLTCESAALIKGLIDYFDISCVFHLVFMTNPHGCPQLLNCLPNPLLGPSDGFWKYVREMIRGWRHCLPQTHRPKDPGWWKGGLWCEYTRLSRSAKHSKTLQWSCCSTGPYRTSRRNVRTRIWSSCRPWSMLTSSAGRRRRRNWSPWRTGSWVATNY